MNKITIYTKENCPFCLMAKNLLQQKGVTLIEEIRIDLDQLKLQEMITKTTKKTVPQIFIGTIYVGGFDDLAALNHGNKLDQLLNN